MTRRKRSAVFPGDCWFDTDGAPYIVLSSGKDKSHGGVICKTVDAYGHYWHFGQNEMLNNFEYVCDRNGDNQKDFFG